MVKATTELTRLAEACSDAIDSSSTNELLEVILGEGNTSQPVRKLTDKDFLATDEKSLESGDSQPFELNLLSQHSHLDAILEVTLHDETLAELETSRKEVAALKGEAAQQAAAVASTQKALSDMQEQYNSTETLRTEHAAALEAAQKEISDWKQQLQQFVNYYNHERYDESLNNLTPADVYYGRGQAILNQREKIKLNTLAMRRKMHYDNQTDLHNLMN